MPLFNYRFTQTSLDRFAEHGVPWQAVLFVLDVAHPVLRERIGAAILRVTGADQIGDLLMVTLIETVDEDDSYDIISARYVEGDEAAAVRSLLKEE